MCQCRLPRASMKLLESLPRRFIHGMYKKVKREPPWNVMFFGNDDFALASLIALHAGKDRGLIGKLDVVTSTMKKISPVQEYCIKERINVNNWPVDIPLGVYDVGTVVSFGHLLPPSVIIAFPLGILNVHGSLLPRWRGAAPIIHALLNNDHETGVTVMEIQPYKFDVGRIVSQATVEISWDMKCLALTNTLANVGASELVSVMENLHENLEKATKQPLTGATKAPKVKETFSRIHWNRYTCRDIQARYRALDDHFPLWTTWQGTTVKLRAMIMHKEWSLPLPSEGLEGKSNEMESYSKYSVINHIENNSDNVTYGGDKIYKIKNCYSVMEKYENNLSNDVNTNDANNHEPGSVVYNKKSKTLTARCLDGWVSFSQVIIKKRKLMTAHEFYNGFVSKVSSVERKFQ